MYFIPIVVKLLFMDSKQLEKRRLERLKNFLKTAEGRNDIKLSLSAIAPTLQIKGFVGGTKFVDKDNPVFEGGSN